MIESLPGTDTIVAQVEGSPLAELDARAVSAWFGDRKVLDRVSLTMRAGEVTALIGPSGCGKTTFLRSINRLNELIPDTRHSGDILLEGVSVYSGGTDPVELRRNVGMVFQRPNPFPKSIFDNVAYGPRLNALCPERDILGRVEHALRQAALWDEVSDRLDAPGTSLSGGQQQRLCIARSLAVRPRVLLMDEPCSALDPIATAKVEELIHELKASFTIIIVTHSMQQAARCSDKTAFFYMGKLIEYADTRTIFMNPSNPQTEAYVSGRFG